MKVSVIIPCYNVENYINKCLDSVLNSSLKELEIIVINDGSTDSTLDKIKKYKDKRIILIDKKNGGVASARNEGLKVATGEYITFLDSDDYIDEDMYKDMYERAIEGNLDIVACDTKLVYPDHFEIIPSLVDDTKINKHLMIDSYAVLWNKIYKKEILEGLFFTKGINLCEDVEFLYKVYSRVKKMDGIKKPYYNYVQRPGSLTYVYDAKIYHIIDAMDNIIKYYKDNAIYDKYRDELEYTYIRYCYATFVKRLSKAKDKKKFNEGIKYTMKKVKENFPDYRDNKYLKSKGKKMIYLRNFNRLFAKYIYIKEKDKGN